MSVCEGVYVHTSLFQAENSAGDDVLGKQKMSPGLPCGQSHV